MEFVRLKTFIAIVDQGGINAAATFLNTVPSNISSRLNKLENELGTKLFKLSGRKLVLTVSGERLYDSAIKILQLVEKAKIETCQQEQKFYLRLGTTETFSAIHLPQTLKLIKQSDRRIIPKIHTATSAKLINCVLQHKVDCAFIVNDLDHPELISTPIFSEQLVLIEPLSREFDAVLLLRDEGCAYRKAALEWQLRNRKESEESLTISSFEGVLGCVAEGLGYTIMSSNIVEHSRHRDALYTEKIIPKQEGFNISLIYRKDSPYITDLEAITAALKTEE